MIIRFYICCALGVLLWSVPGCATIEKAAMNNVADLLSADGSSDVFSSESDPELVRDALPFGLKVYEMLLASNPNHRNLLRTTASAFVQYANGFIEMEADFLESEDFERSKQMKRRAQKLYLRGRDYALRGLAVGYPDIRKSLASDEKTVLNRMKKVDVPLMYWAAAGWGSAISADTGNMALVGELPQVQALIHRAYELDATYGNGAIYEFLLLLEGAKGDMMGGKDEKMVEYYEKVVEITKGNSASPYVTLATALAVRRQDVKLFKDLLNKALAVDVDKVPGIRLMNILAQKRARWLLNRGPELFLEFEPESQEEPSTEGAQDE